MPKPLVVGVVVIFSLLIIYIGFNAISNSKSNSKEKKIEILDTNIENEVQTAIIEVNETKIEENKKINVVNINSNGFSPENLIIEVGSEVKFVNKDSSKHWPASDFHPTHKKYPSSDINKCNGDKKNKIFDACKGLEQNEEYAFVFIENGAWSYHDHLNPGISGVIVVK